MHSKSLRFRKGDIIAVALVLLLAVLVFALFLPGKDDAVAFVEIYQNGQLLHRLSLDQPQELTVSGKYSNTVTIQDGKVSVTHSDCPGEDCVSSGWINRSGRSIVCLPNALEIRVVADHSDVDFVVG